MRDTELNRRMALAARELRMQMPPATLLPAIHRDIERRREASRTGFIRWRSWAAWGGLSTACVALAVVFIVNSLVDDSQPQAADDGFVAIVNNEVWQRARADNGKTWIVTTELPHSRLAVLGLPYDPARAGERMSAQLLMHGSGEVLAVRVNH